MNIAIGSDHAGLALKEVLKKHFTEIHFTDAGTHSENSCDYPEYIGAAAKIVLRGDAELGIGICGTGIGASIAANKFHGIRAALCTNEFMAEMSRLHNNANMLILGARVIGTDLAVRIVERWIATPFEGGRHQRRLDMITAIECGGSLKAS